VRLSVEYVALPCMDSMALPTDEGCRCVPRTETGHHTLSRFFSFEMK
jgi:hypothetical protein